MFGTQIAYPNSIGSSENYEFDILFDVKIAATTKKNKIGRGEHS